MEHLHLHLRRCEAAIANFDPMTPAVYGLSDEFERRTLKAFEACTSDYFTRFALLVTPSRFGLDVSPFVYGEKNREAAGELLRQLAWAMRACAFISLTHQHVAGVHCGSIVVEHRSMDSRRRVLVPSESGYLWTEVPAPNPRPFPALFEPTGEDRFVAETYLRPPVQEIEQLVRADEAARIERATETLADLTDLTARIVKGGEA